MLIQFPKRLKKKGYDIEFLNKEIFLEILSAYKDNKIARDGILPLLENIISLGVFFDGLLPLPCTDNELDKTFRESEDQLKNIKLNKPENRAKVLMGFAMHKLRGRVPGISVYNYIKSKEITLTK